MVHRKNHDLKAELVEMQLAAQQWEDKYLKEVAWSAEVKAANDGLADTIVELRAELGQASRELLAVTEQLDVCRRERGEALDAMHDALELMSEAGDYACGSCGDLIERLNAFELKHRVIEVETRIDLNDSDEFAVTQPGG